MFIEFLLLFFN